MIAAVILVGISVLVMAGVAWTARRVHVGTLDALALAEKVATPRPSSALDWPELRVRAFVPQPDEPAELALPANRPAQVLTQAWLLVWPLQRPWYDASAFCLLAVFPASRLDALMLIRAVPAALAVAVGSRVGAHAGWAARIVSFVGDSLSRDVRLGAAVVAVLLCAGAGWEVWRPPPESLVAEPAAR